MKEENNNFISRLGDIIDRVERNDYEIATDFLDMTQRSIAEKILKTNKNISYEIWGGYENAERVLAFIRPRFMKNSTFEELAVLRVKKSLKGRELGHRDYLGSILGLGIKREKVGDIIVSPHGADIFVKRDLVSFFITNFTKVGNQNIDIEEINMDEINIVESKGEEISDTVASLRMDNIVSSMFKISRKDASKFINQGMVFQNNIEVEKCNKEVSEGDKIVLRGYGRAFLREIGGKSRKDRTYIKLEVFKR